MFEEEEEMYSRTYSIEETPFPSSHSLTTSNTSNSSKRISPPLKIDINESKQIPSCTQSTSPTLSSPLPTPPSSAQSLSKSLDEQELEEALEFQFEYEQNSSMKFSSIYSGSPSIDFEMMSEFEEEYGGYRDSYISTGSGFYEQDDKRSSIMSEESIDDWNVLKGRPMSMAPESLPPPPPFDSNEGSPRLSIIPPPLQPPPREMLSNHNSMENLNDNNYSNQQSSELKSNEKTQSLQLASTGNLDKTLFMKLIFENNESSNSNEADENHLKEESNLSTPSHNSNLPARRQSSAFNGDQRRPTPPRLNIPAALNSTSPSAVTVVSSSSSSSPSVPKPSTTLFNAPFIQPRSVSSNLSKTTTTTTNTISSAMDLSSIIFSSYLLKKSRKGRFQKRIFRFDGIMLICLSPQRIPLPFNKNLSNFDPSDFFDPTNRDIYKKMLTRYYPSNPSMPELTNPLIACANKRNNRRGVGRVNPDMHSPHYHVPKWIIPITSITGFRANLPNSKSLKSNLSRTFTIKTDDRNYVLRAPNPTTFVQWMTIGEGIINANIKAAQSNQARNSLTQSFKRIVDALMLKEPSVQHSLIIFTDDNSPLPSKNVKHGKKKKK